jgi:ethanolamine transporter EutH
MIDAIQAGICLSGILVALSSSVFALFLGVLAGLCVFYFGCLVALLVAWMPANRAHH